MTKPTASPPSPLLRAADQAALPETSFSHPLNPHSQLHLRSLADGVGLQRLGLNLIRVPPGKESFVYHAHHCEEEFIYILSGRGVADIDGVHHEVGPGDFMGFPTPSVGHHLRNPYSEELVYLSGGERREMEIADFPRHGKRLVRVGMAAAIHSLADVELFPGLKALHVAGSRSHEPG
ncbi:MAG: cupin domain-containing protein [Nannocystis sp.]|uniref:cupin domain-containing protein n=1 Tax=Nannocystis sp. TaxID=1962667 RepID=UPI0024220A4B|nr:cupin domain-containing protein [Nannocystis sp.]MBK9754599.1 cupin domain-containing protein [Nannocystis sp.]